MRILWHEIKKMLSVKMVLLLAVVNSLLFFLLIEFDITYFPNGRPSLDHYNISIEMLDKYGMDIDEVELADFKETYQAEVKKVADYLQTKSEYVDKGIRSYEDTRFTQDESEEISRLRWELLDKEGIGDTLWELQSREYITEWIEYEESSLDGWSHLEYTPQQLARIDELKEAEKFPVFPGVAFDNYQDFIVNVALTILISVVILISPIMIKDRATQVLDMQYTTKKGRNLYKVKIVAGLLSSFLVMTTLLGIYFSLYALNKTSMFFELPVHKFIASPAWYDPTFLEYIILTVIAIYVLGFVTTFLAIVFSSIVPNYISLIGIQIPYLFLMISLGMTFLLNEIISIHVPKWLVPTSYSLLLLGSILLIVWMQKREQKRDILL